MPLRSFTALAILLAVAAALYFLVFSQLYYKPVDRERADEENKLLKNGFAIAVVWPPHTDKSLVEGVTLALEEVDAAKGPLAGKIKIRNFVETSDKGAIARDVVQYPDVIAVIGHEVVGTSIPASITYSKHGVIFISPKVTDQRLTHHKMDYVFRLTPDDEAVANALASFAKSHNLRRIGILHGRILRHELVADQFVAAARTNEIVVPFTRSFFHEPNYAVQDFRRMIAEIRSQQFDALMLADDLPWAGKLLVDLKQMGVTQPILASDKLDSMQVWQIAETAANNLYVASSVNPSANTTAYAEFQKNFRRRFEGHDPGYGASQGYEAFMLLVNAITKIGSADPIVVATTMRTNTWQGLFGEYSFDVNGDIMGRDVTIKKMQNGAFQLAAVQREK